MRSGSTYFNFFKSPRELCPFALSFSQTALVLLSRSFGFEIFLFFFEFSGVLGLPLFILNESVSFLSNMIVNKAKKIFCLLLFNVFIITLLNLRLRHLGNFLFKFNNIKKKLIKMSGKYVASDLISKANDQIYSFLQI